ncbi:MAG: DUF6282 family protein [Candidatus Woesearchaeota archaeon]|jgi:hypothetical protein
MKVTEFIDLHVHIGPEVLPRKYTVNKIINKQKGKIRGMALKNHFYPTLPLIESEETRDESDLILLGSVTLNNYIGGLNPDAIYASAKLSKRPIIVWFPTINADNFLKRSKYEIPPEWVGGNFKSRLSDEIKGINIMDDKMNLIEDAKKVLKAIKDNNCILATGHVSSEEARILVIEANKLGIKKIIVTHPIYQQIDMPIEIQKELASYDGVYIEQNYAMYAIDKIPIERIVQQINAIGAEKCILSSDVGQINSPSPSEALEEFTELLEVQGISVEDLRTMGEINPRKLIE